MASTNHGILSAISAHANLDALTNKEAASAKLSNQLLFQRASDVFRNDNMFNCPSAIDFPN
jgi:hypothetical protein